VGTVTVALQGRGVVAGTVEGEALVCPKGIGAFGGLDPRTGVIEEYDKILVMPGSKGSNGWSCYFTATWVAGAAPKGWIFTRIDSSAAVATVILQIPTVVDFAVGEDPCALIQTGDWVRMDGETGVVEITKPGAASAAE
jgi:predicted aconitase with swiveling domain